MKRIIKTSKIIACIYIVLALILAGVCLIRVAELASLSLIIPALQGIIILIWYIIMIRTSSEHHLLRIPSIIGILGTISLIISSAYTAELYFGSFMPYGWMAARVALYIAIVLHFVALVWLAILFRKGSIVQITTILLALTPVVFNIIDLYRLEYIHYVIDGTLWAIFLFNFAKSADKIHSDSKNSFIPRLFKTKEKINTLLIKNENSEESQLFRQNTIDEMAKNISTIKKIMVFFTWLFAICILATIVALIGLA